jgi:hypothetical protein
MSIAYTWVTISKKYGHGECIIMEMTGIELHPDNMNREEGFLLNS